MSRTARPNSFPAPTKFQHWRLDRASGAAASPRIIEGRQICWSCATLSHTLRRIRASPYLRNEHASEVGQRALCDKQCLSYVVLLSDVLTGGLNATALGVMRMIDCLHFPRQCDMQIRSIWRTLKRTRRMVMLPTRALPRGNSGGRAALTVAREDVSTRASRWKSAWRTRTATMTGSPHHRRSFLGICRH